MRSLWLFKHSLICVDCSFYLLKLISFFFPKSPHSSLMNIFSLFLFGSLWPYHFCLIPPLIPLVFSPGIPFLPLCTLFPSHSLSSLLIFLPFQHLASVFVVQCWVQEECHQTAITTKLYPTLSALLPLHGFDPVCASICEKVVAEVDMAVKFYNTISCWGFF